MITICYVRNCGEQSIQTLQLGETHTFSICNNHFDAANIIFEDAQEAALRLRDQLHFLKNSTGNKIRNINS